MIKNFEKHGFIHIKNLLSKDEITYYKKLLQSISSLNDQSFSSLNKPSLQSAYSKSNGVVQHEEFWPLIYHNKLISILNELLPEPPCFLQHSDLHVHHGAVGWHRDNINRSFKKGPDWDEEEQPYSVLRVALYLQSFNESKFKMGVIPGSNRKESSMNSLELKLWSAYRRITNKLPPFYITLNPTWIEIEAGDCLVFDQRLLHTGTLPKGPKYSIYLGYGVNNQHAQRHINYYYNRNDLDYSPMPAKLIDILLKKSLLVTELIKNTTKPSLI